MKRNEILQSLCYHDKRHPDYDEYDDDRIVPSQCYCDHCFHGNSELAEELLRMFDENELLKQNQNK